MGEESEGTARGGEGGGLGGHGSMRRRRVTLQDGRYLIFYTFGGEGAREEDESPSSGAGDALPEPKAKPEAEEERSV